MVQLIVPLSVKDATAQDLLWEYAQRRRAVDAEFAADLEEALLLAGFVPPFIAHCTCGANTVCAGVFGPPPHKDDCALSRHFTERTIGGLRL